MRCYGNKALSATAEAYVELIRDTPLTVQLFIVYFGLPSINVFFSATLSIIIALSLNSAAYQSEYFRGAIESISGGQMDAARSTGMSRLQAIRYVILPQALRLALPSWSNEAAYMPSLTSVAYLVAVPELMSRAKITAINIFEPMQVYLVTGLIYLIVITTLSKALDIVYQRYKLKLD
jgi:polar amino acid transport system permease protein